MKENNQKKARRLTGVVVSDKMDKTLVVKTVQHYQDPRFKKVLKKDKKYKVHDEQEVAKVGDVVEICEGRPLSKEKFMYLERVVRSASA